MYHTIQILASISIYFNAKLKEASMPKSTIAFASLVVVSLTLLCSLWIVRHSLCDVHYLDERVDFQVTLAYESR
ncbi:Hok/Gef family protein [Vibrio vulnificus]